ncbi:MAG: hypothetical protein JXR51_00510 [Bacteroidales bacterium]|nr:hypothetical protein [Bacteroidales bacterium]MBN2755622.1 hypothetical protein [Bacteroidales bacterium]
MKNLEDFINENREAFDSSNLSENHLEKFEKKLFSDVKQKRKINYWYAIAATIILLIGFSIVIEQNISDRAFVNNKNTSLSDISVKYSEVELFYKNDLDQKLNEFDHLNCKIGDEQRQMIDIELKQLDIVYHSLQNELKNNKNDQRIIDAMINNYQTKIQFIELVINQIKNNC